MRTFKTALFSVYFFFIFHWSTAQTDLNYARTPAQTGILVAPPIMNDAGKYAIQFKSRGDTTRWTAGFNYFDITDQSDKLKDIELISVTDTCANYRVWYDDGYSMDLRFGMEKRKYTGLCNVQYRIGAEGLIGFLRQKKTYWNQTQAISGVTGYPGFFPTPGSLGYFGDGVRNSDYFKGGVYVFQSFSFIWLERLCVDIRSSAEFDFHIKLKDEFTSDPDNVLNPGTKWFFDFRLSIIEIGLSYVFRK